MPGGVLVALALAAASACALAQAPRWPDALSGTMLRIKDTRTVRIGYRETAIPFSYVGAAGRPVGYSLDLCAAIVDDLAEALGVAALAIELRPVAPAERVDRVAAGDIDLECGSTTGTTERRRRAAFSPVIFLTGTRLAVPSVSTVRSFQELGGRAIGVVGGTSNEATIRELDRRNALGLRIVAVADYGDLLALLDAGKADAIAADDVLLRGVIAETGKAGNVRLVGDILALEPYGIMYARDEPAFDAVVEGALRRLARSGELLWIYDRWFVRRLPSGQRLDLPLSPALRRAFELLGLPPD
jgi:glutamate/aspartate transport system substrate-binding protein